MLYQSCAKFSAHPVTQLLSFISWSWDIISNKPWLRLTLSRKTMVYKCILKGGNYKIELFCHIIQLDIIQPCPSSGPKTVHLVSQFSFWNCTLSNLRMFCLSGWFKYLAKKKQFLKTLAWEKSVRFWHCHLDIMAGISILWIESKSILFTTQKYY